MNMGKQQKICKPKDKQKAYKRSEGETKKGYYAALNFLPQDIETTCHQVTEKDKKYLLAKKQHSKKQHANA